MAVIRTQAWVFMPAMTIRWQLLVRRIESNSVPKKPLKRFLMIKKSDGATTSSGSNSTPAVPSTVMRWPPCRTLIGASCRSGANSCLIQNIGERLCRASATKAFTCDARRGRLRISRGCDTKKSTCRSIITVAVANAYSIAGSGRKLTSFQDSVAACWGRLERVKTGITFELTCSCPRKLHAATESLYIFPQRSYRIYAASSNSETSFT